MFQIRIILLFSLLVGFSGCEKVSPEALVQQAEQAIHARQIQRAVVSLRSVLQQEPGNARARWLLAEAYLAIEDGPAAEKELLKAAQLGVGEEAVIPMLAKALVMQGRADDVLAISPEGELSSAAAAELDASRAMALIMKGEVEQAEIAISRATRLSPDSVHVLYAHAKTLLATQHPDDAERELRALTEQRPEYAPAWSLLGKALGQRRDFEGAEEAHSKAIDNRFLAVKDRIDRGFARLALAKLDEAQDDVTVLMKIAPEMHRVHLLAGLIYIEKQELDAAKEALELAYSKNQDHLWGTVALATVDTLLGNYNQGRRLSDRAFAMAPQNVSARKLVAGYALLDRDGVRAESLIKPVVRVDPEDMQAQQILAGSLVLQGKVSEAAVFAEHVAAEAADSANAQLWAGVTLMAAGKRDAAVKLLDKAAQLSPESRGANSLLVLGLIDNKSKAEALLAAQEFAAANPVDAEAQNLLAYTHLAVGNETSADAVFRQALALDPGNRTATRLLANIAMRSGDISAARSVLDSALAVKPNDSDLLVMRASISAKDADLKAQTDYLQRAVEANPGHLGPRVMLAQSFYDLGQMDAVRRAFSGVSLDGNARALALNASAAYRLGIYDEAKVDLEALAGLEPTSADVQFELLKVYHALGDEYLEERTIETLAEIVPADERVKLAHAKLLAKRGEIAKAESLIRSIGLPPEDPRVLSTQLAVAVAGERSADVLRYSKRLHAIVPDSQNIIVLSRAYSATGDDTQSIAVLETWLDGYPADIPVMTELANSYRRLNKQALYEDQLRQILNLEPTNTFALNNLAWSLLDSSPVDALRYARTAYDQERESSSIMDTLAMAYARNRDYDNALRFATKAIDSAPTTQVFRLHRAEIKSLSGDRDGALSELRDILEEEVPIEIRARVESLVGELERKG